MVFVFLSYLVLTLRLAMRGPNAWQFPTFSNVRFGAPLRYLAAALLPVGFWLQIRVSAFQASHDGPRDPWFSTLPLPVVDEALPFDGPLHTLLGAAALGCVVLMTVALFILCWSPPRDKRMCIAIVLSGFAVALLAVSAPVLSSTDAYFYVFAGEAGLASYAPPPDLLNPANATMNRFIPLRGLIYGPLWIAINAFILSFGHTVAQKIVLLRVLNAMLLVGAAFALRALRVSGRAQLAFVLNPTLWFYIVLNAHNDLMGLLPCLLALIVAPAYVWAAVGLVATAGCIKLPFLVVGIPAFTRLANVWQTLGAIVCALTLALAASWQIAGAPYFRDLLGYVNRHGVGVDAAGKAFGVIAALVYLAIIAIAILRRRFFPGAAYLIAYLSPLVFPWYLVWGIPYAASASSALAATLLAMPLSAALLDGTYGLRNVGELAFVVISSACLMDAVHAKLGPAYFRSRP